MNNTVEGYLAQLTQQLAGADPAVVQDAVYDAEEYLRSALAEEGSDPEALSRVIDTYGAPEEVAFAYLETERTVTQALRPTAPPKPRRSLLGKVFGVVVDPSAWGSLFYMFLALVTGIVYFTVVVAGMSLSLGLLITLLGIPIALLFIAIVRSVSLAEGRMVEGLLGVRMPRRPRMAGVQGNIWTRLKSWFTDYRTWTTMLYMLLQLPLGVLYFTMLITGFTMSASVLSLPFAQELFGTSLIRAGETMYLLNPWAYPLAVLLGLAGFILTLWVAKGIGKLHGAYAKVMLVGGFVDQGTEETTAQVPSGQTS